MSLSEPRVPVIDDNINRCVELLEQKCQQKNNTATIYSKYKSYLYNLQLKMYFNNKYDFESDPNTWINYLQELLNLMKIKPISKLGLLIFLLDTFWGFKEICNENFRPNIVKDIVNIAPHFLEAINQLIA